MRGEFLMWKNGSALSISIPIFPNLVILSHYLGAMCIDGSNLKALTDEDFK